MTLKKLPGGDALLRSLDDQAASLSNGGPSPAKDKD